MAPIRARDTLYVAATRFESVACANSDRLLAVETFVGVAFLAAGPGITQGKVLPTALDMTDFGPTFLDLLSAQGKLEHAHGRNAAPLFRTGTAPADWQDLVCMRSTSQLNPLPENLLLPAVTVAHASRCRMLPA